MILGVRRAAFRDVEAMREAYRREAGCQIVHDSALPRGIADPYRILVEGRTAGYAGVFNRYYEGRVMELYLVPDARRLARPIFRELARSSGATHVEAQTNLPLMHDVLRECARNVVEEKILFEDGGPTRLRCPAGAFRRATADDGRSDGEWVIDVDGTIVAAGGILTHYNPPYGDIYMEVSETARRKGFGSYLVQELKRVCRDAGRAPAARCDPSNVASRRTLERAGFVVCGRLLVGELARAGSAGAREAASRAGEA